MTYQGWTNAATWCVTLWLNNDKKIQDEALNIVRHSWPYYAYNTEAQLMRLVCSHYGAVYDIAPWVWETETLKDVNWREIIGQLDNKIKEGA